MKDELHRPMATYRLQFNQDFRFADAQRLVPYFSRLGITHLYASPILRARQESTHGYDVVNSAMINPNLGDKTELYNLHSTLQNYGLGFVLDIVPNHMAATIENPYWRDVLTYGPSSPFAGWFDIDWRMPDTNMWGRVLVPVLGEPRSRVLEKGQIHLDWSDGRFLVRYFDHTFPVDPATISSICDFGWEDLKQKLGPDHPALEQIREILGYLDKLPKSAARLRRKVHIDRDETERELAMFAHIVVQSPTIQQWVEETAAGFHKGPGGRERLRRLLEAQPYRLVHWRDAARTINYRRFFNINELVSVRQEDPQVFQDTHATVLRWVEDGLIQGLRIDHIDGLRDPLGYLERLAEVLSRGEHPERRIPVFVEKILAPHEKLPCGWPVAGTTGYEFLNQLEGIFIAPEGFSEIERYYQSLFRRPIPFEDIAQWGKRLILRNDLSPQVGRLADLLWRLAEQCEHTRHSIADASPAAATAAVDDSPDKLAAASPPNPAVTLADHRSVTRKDLVDAIVEVIVALTVYRTYIDRHHGIISDADRHYLEQALEGARQSGRAAVEAVDFLGEVLLLRNREELREHDIHERLNFIERFQQLTGPAAAKGIEDTALYAYVPLVSLNEVGGEPKLPADDPVAWLHEANQERSEGWPMAILSVTTHDTKRTADVRARLDVLSEIPESWISTIKRWRRMNERHRSNRSGKQVPDPSAEYLVYQTLIGIWPAPDPRRPESLPAGDILEELRERTKAYMLKAAREAKTRTSWTNQNPEYEEGLLAFVEALFSEEAGFLPEVQRLTAQIARPGFWNSLSRTLIQLTAPGTPDIYQGDELWNFALVDPDNRRPADYETRQQMLDDVITHFEGREESSRPFLESLVESPEDGRIKLHLVHTALVARHTHPQLFVAGRYLPLEVAGSQSRHAVAYGRLGAVSSECQTPDEVAIIIAPRQTMSLTGDPARAPVGEDLWSDTVVRLPEPLRNREWKSLLTGEQITPPAHDGIPLAMVLKNFPASLLVGKREM